MGKSLRKARSDVLKNAPLLILLAMLCLNHLPMISMPDPRTQIIPQKLFELANIEAGVIVFSELLTFQRI